MNPVKVHRNVAQRCVVMGWQGCGRAAGGSLPPILEEAGPPDVTPEKALLTEVQTAAKTDVPSSLGPGYKLHRDSVQKVGRAV